MTKFGIVTQMVEKRVCRGSAKGSRISKIIWNPLLMPEWFDLEP